MWEFQNFLLGIALKIKFCFIIKKPQWRGKKRSCDECFLNCLLSRILTPTSEFQSTIISYPRGLYTLRTKNIVGDIISFFDKYILTNLNNYILMILGLINLYNTSIFNILITTIRRKLVWHQCWTDPYDTHVSHVVGHITSRPNISILSIKMTQVVVV